MILLHNLPQARALIWNILTEIKLLHTIKMRHTFLHCVNLLGITEENIGLLRRK